jgi:hypothetical protein
MFVRPGNEDWQIRCNNSHWWLTVITFCLITAGLIIAISYALKVRNNKTRHEITIENDRLYCSEYFMGPIRWTKSQPLDQVGYLMVEPRDSQLQREAKAEKGDEQDPKDFAISVYSRHDQDDPSFLVAPRFREAFLRELATELAQHLRVKLEVVRPQRDTGEEPEQTRSILHKENGKVGFEFPEASYWRHEGARKLALLWVLPCVAFFLAGAMTVTRNLNLAIPLFFAAQLCLFGSVIWVRLILPHLLKSKVEVAVMPDRMVIIEKCKIRRSRLEFHVDEIQSIVVDELKNPHGTTHVLKLKRAQGSDYLFPMATKDELEWIAHIIRETILPMDSPKEMAKQKMPGQLVKNKA